MRLIQTTCTLSLALAAGTANAQLSGGPPAQPIPLGDVIFVVDGSSSISNDQFDVMIDGIVATLGDQIPTTANYRVAVVQFGTVSGVTATLEIPFTRANDPNLAADIAAIAQRGGGTDVPDAVELARDEFLLDLDAASKHVVLLTDECESAPIAVGDELRAFDIRVSAACVQNICTQIGIRVCPASALDDDLLAVLDFANMPRYSPFTAPPRGPVLHGVVGCFNDPLDSNDADALALDVLLWDALCPFSNPLGDDDDANLIVDSCDLDCDGDGIPDFDEDDTCANGVPDECETDCDGDGIPDACDSDRDGDGIPDKFDPEINPSCPYAVCVPVPINPGG